MNIDRAAIGLSLVCAIHCVLLPMALVLLPALTATLFASEAFHKWMLIAVLPTSLLALGMGCRRHRRKRVLVTGVLGLTLLTLAAFLGHDWVGESGEKAVSLLGASLIALGHWRNYSFCRDLQCDARAGRL